MFPKILCVCVLVSPFRVPAYEVQAAVLSVNALPEFPICPFTHILFGQSSVCVGV